MRLILPVLISILCLSGVMSCSNQSDLDKRGTHSNTGSVSLMADEQIDGDLTCRRPGPFEAISNWKTVAYIVCNGKKTKITGNENGKKQFCLLDCPADSRLAQQLKDQKEATERDFGYTEVTCYGDPQATCDKGSTNVFCVGRDEAGNLVGTVYKGEKMQCIDSEVIVH